MPLKKSVSPATADHPIYGSTGPMRGILWPGYGIDNAYPKVEWKVFGDNGCVVGMCWAKQAAAVRDGAHGKHMSGVSGNPYDGIYSLIVSKGENEDSGSELWYLPSGNSTTSSIANEAALATDDCLMFAKSIATQEPVRVLRAASAKSQFSPKIGIRYDGLYQVDGVESVATDAGGSYVRFHLTRMPGQADIDTNLPNDTDAAVFAEVPNGY